MLSVFLKIFLMMLFAMLLIFLGLMLVFKGKKSSGKLSPFECGFNPRFSSRLPFSLQFFLVAIIFVIFDVELILLFPFFSFVGDSWGFVVYSLFVSFLVLLTTGLVLEWNQQMLNWLI